MNIVLFEDFLADDLRPLTLARPAFALTVGGVSLLEAVRRLAPDAAVSWIVRPHLAEVTPLRYAGGIPAAPLPAAGEPVLFLNAQLVPRLALLADLIARARGGTEFWIPLESGEGRVVALATARLPFALEAADPRTITPQLVAHPGEKLWGEAPPFLEFPWQVVRAQGTELKANLEALVRLAPRDGEEPWRERADRPGVWTRGEVALRASVECDTADGPVVLDAGASVGPFTYLRGPLFAGAGAAIVEHASIKSHTTVGAHCKVGGEVHSTVFEAYSNKGHHGFLGHAWVGSWVNLGAGTTNSNLKNTYGEVVVELGERRMKTGMQFLGCLIGDYSKSAINTSVFTGKIVGISSYLYGFVGANVPSFCNYARTFGQVSEFRLDAAQRTQERMFARRGLAQTPADERLLASIHEMTQRERLMSRDSLLL